MADNSRKTPLVSTIPSAIRRQFADAMQIEGKALPCHVTKVISSGIYEVAFDLTSGFTLPKIIVPVAGSQYVREPIQVDEKGFTIPADAYLGGVSGLGGGIADLTQVGNLTALVFCPCGNTSWTVVDGNVLTLYGPNGVTIRDSGSASTIVLTPTDIKLTRGSTAFELDGTNVKITGALQINGSPYLMHEHSGVTTGSGNTGGVV